MTARETERAEVDPRRMRVETIVIGTDGSETADRAVEFALEMAGRYGAQLVVASAYEPASEERLSRDRDEAPTDVRWSISPTGGVEGVLRAVEQRAEWHGLRVTSEARTGKPAKVLCDIATDYRADVLVVGSKGMHRKHLASVPNAISHEAPCSVVVVKTT